MEKQKLNEILDENISLSNTIQQNDMLLNELRGVLRSIESIILEDARQNFYTNLQTLDFVLDNENMSSKTLSGYSKEENKIYINPKYNEILTDVSGISDNEKINQALIESIYHELLHMASTTRDEENKYYSSGLIIKKFQDGELLYEEEFDSLTEGMTELLTNQVFGKGRVYSSYRQYTNMANHLSNIVGLDELKKAYFNNRNGIQNIETKLTSIDGLESHDELYQMMQSDYNAYIGNEFAEFDPYLISEIEKRLLYISKKDIEDKIQNDSNFSQEQIQNYWNDTKKTINSEENLYVLGVDVSKYRNLGKIQEIYEEYMQDTLHQITKKSDSKNMWQEQVFDGNEIAINTLKSIENLEKNEVVDKSNEISK